MPVTFTPTPSTNTQPLDRLGSAATGDTRGYGHRWHNSDDTIATTRIAMT